MNRTSLLLISILALSIGILPGSQAGEPVIEGFPWPDPADEIIIEVPLTDKSVRIDGDLSDNCWKTAGEIKRLYRVADGSVSGAVYSIGVLFDGENLLFGIDLPAAKAAHNPDKCYLSNEFDLIRSGPGIRICLDPLHEHGVYYQFVIDPAGRRQDLRVADESWSAVWSARVNQASGRWRTEIMIPLKDISIPPEGGDIWGFNFLLSGMNDRGTLSSTPIRICPEDAERFGHLLFTGDLSSGRLAAIKASLPGFHRQQKQTKLAANRAMCGPELIDIPGELEELIPAKEYSFENGLKFTCLGIDNPPIVRTRFPYFYEKYETPELQRLKKQYRLDEIIASGSNEFEQMVILNDWLYNNITFGSPPAIALNAGHVLRYGLAGQTYNCTYLSYTLSQIYKALGWVSRKISSQGRGTLDVWSNYWRKWIQVNPPTNSYFRLRGQAVPLNSNEIRREFWRNRGIDMEIVYGAGQRAEAVTLERKQNGLYRYRQDGFAWVGYKTRGNFQEVPFTWRNYLFLIVEDEYNRGKKWSSIYTGGVDERMAFSVSTDRLGDIFWTLNQAFIHLYSKGGSVLKVQLETVTPNFKTFEIATDSKEFRGAEPVFNTEELEWQETEPVFDWNLYPGTNVLLARSINKFGVRGPKHKIVIGIGEEPEFLQTPR
ncbi:MAG: hypothetical protein U9P14_05615 [Gemmatimonadota bacterium]|nr:hypothetical protein [Gemmatimonadota bacterium]